MSEIEQHTQMYSEDIIADNTAIANLCALWKQETEGYSSISKKINNKHYLKICESSRYVTVPLLLREMQTEPDHWFVALKRLTGTDPTQNCSKDCSFEEETQAWIEWRSSAQDQMLIGEIGELLALFGRSAQGRDTKQQWVEETADVFIMLFQLANTIGTEEVSECSHEP